VISALRKDGISDHPAGATWALARGNTGIGAGSRVAPPGAVFWIARQTGQNAYFVTMLRIGGELDGGFDLIIKRQIERRAMLKMAVRKLPLCTHPRNIQL
jgi:hypothetical protein